MGGRGVILLAVTEAEFTVLGNAYHLGASGNRTMTPATV
jgi:hypothetical protein